MPRLADWFALVRFTHTLFALPFALIALLAATGGRPSPRLLVLVVLCAVAARTAAMAYNRFADRDVDALNPRTAGREIPRGRISARGALLLAGIAGAVFVAVCAMIGRTCALFAVPVLLWLCAYSHLKRFSALCHLWLGAALGLAPVAAWVAARDRAGAPLDLVAPVLLGAGVLFWVAGFDVLYAAQDEAVDRAHALHSIPSRFGARTALRFARLLHVLATAAFAAFGVVAGLGYGHGTGVVLAAGLLWWQHAGLRPDALAQLQPRFFFKNGLVSVAMLAAGAVDVYFGS